MKKSSLILVFISFANAAFAAPLPLPLPGKKCVRRMIDYMGTLISSCGQPRLKSNPKLEALNLREAYFGYSETPLVGHYHKVCDPDPVITSWQKIIFAPQKNGDCKIIDREDWPSEAGGTDIDDSDEQPPRPSDGAR
jgi:hypothetical protein